MPAKLAAKPFVRVLVIFGRILEGWNSLAHNVVSGKVLGKLRTFGTALSKNFRLPPGISQWPHGSWGRLQEGSQTFFPVLYKSNIILGSLLEVTGTSSCIYQNTIPPMTGQYHPDPEHCQARDEVFNLLRLAASVHLQVFSWSLEHSGSRW